MRNKPTQKQLETQLRSSTAVTVPEGTPKQQITIPLLQGYSKSQASWLLRWLRELGLAKRVGHVRTHRLGMPAVVWEVPQSFTITFLPESPPGSDTSKSKEQTNG